MSRIVAARILSAFFALFVLSCARGDADTSETLGVARQAAGVPDPTTMVTTVNKASTIFGEPFVLTAVLHDTTTNTDIQNAIVSFGLPGFVESQYFFPISANTGNSVNPQAQINTINLPAAGAVNVSVTYAGNATHAAVNKTVPHTVTLGTVTMPVTRDIASPVVGDNVTFTAHVNQVSPSLKVPTGSVNFTDDITGDTANIPIDGSSGSAVASWTEKVTAGNHTFHAQYLPATWTFTGIGTDSIINVIGKAASKVTLSTDLSPTVVGQSATVHALAQPASASSFTPSGTVHFTITNTPADVVGAITLGGGTATFSTTALAPGAHAVKATYDGDSNFDGSTASDISQQVNQDGTTITVVETPPSPSTYPANVALDFTLASVASGGTPTGAYHVFDGSTKLADGTLSAGKSSTVTLTSPAGGTHALSFVYDGDANHAPTTKSFSHVVNAAAATLTLVDSGNSSFGQSFSLTATIGAIGSVAPTGTITFKEGATVLGTGAAPVAVLSRSDLAVGPHTITVSYAGDASYASPSKNQVHTVVAAATTTTLTSGANPSNPASPASFTVVVAPTVASANVPGGTVSLLEGATVVASGPLDGSGHATLTATLALGAHTLHVSYPGDARFAASVSSDLVQNVSKAASGLTLASSANPSTAGAPVTLTASIPSVAGLTATGAVVFKDGATVLGSVDLAAGVATFTVNAFTTGAHPLTVTYAGDANFAAGNASLGQTVNAATTSVSFALAPSTAAFGQLAKLTATVTGAATGTVKFREGGVDLATVALVAGVASFDKADFPVGSHLLTAAFVADADHAASSQDATLVVNEADTAIVLTSSANPAHLGSPVTLTAAVSVVSPGAGTPGGTVTFRDGATVLGTAGVGAGGVATLITSTLGEGPHSLTADVAATTSFEGSTSPELALSVSATAVTIELAPAPAHITFGDSVTFTVTVTSATSGSVAVVEGGTTLCTATLDASGIGKCTATGLHAGTHAVVAAFETSSSGASVIVDRAVSTITLGSSANPATLGQAITFTAAAGPTATGDVDIFLGPTLLGTLTLSSGGASLVKSDLPVGTYAITAHYKGDADHAEATSAPIAQIVRASDDPDGGTEDAGASSSSSSSGGTPDSSIAAPPTSSAADGGLGGLAIGGGNGNGGDGGCSSTGTGAGSSLGFGLAILGLAFRRRRRA